MEVNGHADICHVARTSSSCRCIRPVSDVGGAELTGGGYKTSSEEGYGRIHPIGEVSNEYKPMLALLIGKWDKLPAIPIM